MINRKGNVLVSTFRIPLPQPLARRYAGGLTTSMFATALDLTERAQLALTMSARNPGLAQARELGVRPRVRAAIRDSRP